MAEMLGRPSARWRGALAGLLKGGARRAYIVKRAMWPALAVAGVLLTVGIYASWRTRAAYEAPPGFAKTNGRIEAERVDVATKFAGRLKEVLVEEGGVVKAGQVVARMDAAGLEAQFREAEAAFRQTEQQLDQATALLEQRHGEHKLADQDLSRSLQLVTKGFTPQEKVDQRRAAKVAAEAAVKSAEAQIGSAKAAIEAAAAKVQRIQTELDDQVLTAPRAGRVQYRLALAGEVLAAGGKVLTILDLTDVYMTVFLPTSEAGRLAFGSEARVVFDAAPQYVVPATVAFVAADAQFTPKYVETKSEREKLMFRVKLQIPREVLEKHAALVKTGVPGAAYVKLAREAKWPARLGVRLPE